MTIKLNPIHEPGLLLFLVMQLLNALEVSTHLSHFSGERVDPFQQRGLLQILYRLVTINDCIPTAETVVKEGFQVILLPFRCYGLHNLIAIEIGKECRHSERVITPAVLRTCIKNAVEAEAGHCPFRCKIP